SWRWVFYVNLPFGIAATLGLIWFMPKEAVKAGLRFDWIGFSALSIGLGCLQMMLDRGQDQDWFTSREIVIEAVFAGLGFYLFVVHLLTARNPFIKLAVFRDRNLVAALFVMFAVGSVLLASSALLAPWLQNLANYPVATAGVLLAPRGIGTMAAMMIGGRLSNRYDPRLIMFAGLIILIYSLWMMTAWTPDVSARDVILCILLQGVGLGFVFVPLQVLAFWTLPGHYRTDGTALLSLFRNVGSAIGISAMSALLAHNQQVLHATISAQISPFNRALQVGGTVGDYWITSVRQAQFVTLQQGLALLDGVVNRQAEIIAYLDDFKLMMFTAIPAVFLLLLLRRPTALSARSGPGEIHVMD
ncbi:MAG: MFS transporter, partial [Alphaproteobacteria bacterium]|nr:MFS transporter [Alphaproteobacteria bacterium]